MKIYKLPLDDYQWEKDKKPNPNLIDFIDLVHLMIVIVMWIGVIGAVVFIVLGGKL